MLRVHVLSETQNMVFVGLKLVGTDDYWSVHSVDILLEELIGVYGCGLACRPSDNDCDVVLQVPKPHIEENCMRNTQQRVANHEAFTMKTEGDDGED